MNKLESLSEIFQNSIFRIPDYQRGYSWEVNQLDEFWEDIINLPQNSDHYTGMISLRELDKDLDRAILDKWNNEKWLLDDKEYQAFHVVDGQQRLTTIIILLQVIVELYREKGVLNANLETNNTDIDNSQIMIDDATSLADLIEKYLVIKKPNSNLVKSYLFGYEVERSSDDYFKTKILNPEYSGEVVTSFYTLNLDYAKSYFKERLEDLYNLRNDFTEIYKIYKKVTNNLKFNKYVIDKNFNINVAFETMNNRGKKLSNLELLKNRLIYLTSLLSLPSDDEVVLMKTINDTWKRIYKYLGMSSESKLDDDDFLLAHSYVYFGYIEAVKKDYADFLLKKYFNQSRIFNGGDIRLNDGRDYVDDDTSDIEEVFDTTDLSKKLTSDDIFRYINSLSELVPYWYYLHFQKTNNSDLNVWLAKLKRLEFNYFRPLILVVLSKSYITDDKKLELLKAVERFIFVTFRLCGFQTTYCRHIYIKYTNLLYFDEILIDEVIMALGNIDAISDNNVIDMNIGILSTVNKLFKNSGFYSWKANKYFLYEYEASLVEKFSGVQLIDADNYFNTKKISVEHIFPQSESSSYWLSIFDDSTLEERNRFRGSLGNLLPLALDINRDLQDHDFEVKKERYKNGSYSEREVYDYRDSSGVSIWNGSSILSRGLSLVKFLEDRWNVKFQCKYDKIRFLGLDFLNSEDYKYEDYVEPVYLEDERSSNRYERTEYNIEYHLSGVNDNTKELFYEIDSRVKREFADILVRVNKIYVGYSKNNNFLQVHFRKNNLYIYVLPSDEYDDVLGKLEIIPDTYRWKVNTRMAIFSIDDIDYAMNFIRKSYDMVSNRR